MFAFGQTCPQGCPEDLNRDGQVDDADLLTVQFNFGQCAASLSWTYQYDVWGNLTNARSDAATLNALYDSLGRRVGVFVYRSGAWLRLYRLYEGDTLLAEVDGDSGQVVAEYVWGPLGPIARLDTGSVCAVPVESALLAATEQAGFHLPMPVTCFEHRD